MKRILLSLISLFAFSAASAATNVFHENFEVVDSTVSSANPAWFHESALHVSGAFSIRDTVPVNDTAFLSTIAFSTAGNFNVTLDFWHICKISFADAGIIQVSTNNGASWTQLTTTNSQYLGTAGFGAAGNSFSSAVYGPTSAGWDAINDFSIPTNSWWKHEVFDVSTLLGNASQVKIRFALIDQNFSGSDGNYGWVIDDINVVASPNELNPPHIAWSPPIIQGNMYNLGPYTIKDTITDASALGAISLFYSINGGATQQVTMTNSAGNIWQGIIPAVNNGDTVCYYVQASDTWGNTALLPTVGTLCFAASSGIVFPYVDNFDVSTNLWVATASPGSSAWQIGTPGFGATNTAHSPPNSWDIDLASGYLPNSADTLTSPVFDFTNRFNPTLSFWLNYNTEGAYDGTRLEYTTDGSTWNVLGTVNDPNATNWYTRASIFSSTLPAWAGTSGGWQQSTYKLGCLFTGQVQFRFVFTSDGSFEIDGCSLDDFSITLAPPNDVGVTAVLQPGASAPAGATDSVRVVIANFGSNPASNFNINYSVNGGTPVTQLYSGTLPVCNGVDTVLFAVPFLAPGGAFDVCAYTTLSGDGDISNDTTCKSSQGIPLLTLPYTDDFETPPAYWYDSSATGTNWQLGTPAFGVTNSAHSPSNAWDVNLTTAYGNDAYSVLFSPLFNFSGLYNTKLSFWLNDSTEAGWDGTRLEYSLDAGSTWNVMGTVGDPNATNWYTDAQLNSSLLPAWERTTGGWQKCTYRLGTVPGLNNNPQPVQLKFVFTSDGSVIRDGASIDDIAIDLAAPQDVGVASIISPSVFSTVGASDTVKIVITNYGGFAASNFNVGYSVNGVNVATQLYSNTLAPAVSDTIIFTTPFIVPVGNYGFCAYTLLSGDGDTSNDTLCATRHGLPIFTLPYYDSYDTGAVVWFDSSRTTTPATLWELGTPAFGQTSGTHSPPNSWDINLTSAYGINALSNLISPIFNFTGVYNARLSFYQNYRTQAFNDGMRLEYSTDGGNSWSVLGTALDTAAAYWYTDPQMFSTQLPAWEGTSTDTVTGAPGWIRSSYHLWPLNNAGTQVMFKFVFTSTGFTSADGVSIDDFKIVPHSPLDASAVLIIQPSIYAPAGALDSVRVVIKNEGYSPISNFNVSYLVNGVLAGTGTYTGTLQPNLLDTITLPPFTVPTATFDICAFTSLTGDIDATNDTTCRSSYGIPLVPISYFDDFEGVNNFFTDNNDWELGVPASSIIDSAYSPTIAWKTRLIGNYSNNDDDYLYTPFFDFSQAYKAVLRFHHWYITDPNVDGGRVDYSIDGGNTWRVLGSQGDPYGTNWYNDPALFSGLPGWQGNSHGYVLSEYKLDSLNGFNQNYVQFRFNFTSNGFNTQNGWCVDNFEVFNPITRTAAPVLIEGINNPFNISGPQPVQVWIKNKGSFDLNTVDATLQVDGATILTDAQIPFSPPLHTGDSALHVFSQSWNVPLGGHDVCAITSNPNAASDLDPSDDTLCVMAGKFDSVTVTNSTPYCNDFEPGNGYRRWIPLNAFNYALYRSHWQYGFPSKTIINSVHSGSNAWVTDLDADYGPRDSSGLFSPVFAVDTVGCYELSFYHTYITEHFQDGGTVEASVNNGVTWKVVGYVNEPDWFDSPYVTGLVGGPPTAGWSGVSSGWVHAAHNVRFNQSGHVIFRFRFGSDLSNQQEGWAIDDVCFRKVGACTIGINEVDGTNATLEQNYPNPASDMTYITYSIPEHGKVKLVITDVLGREINVLVNHNEDAGMHLVKLDVKDMADGMYYCTLEMGNTRLIRKVVVAK